MRIVENRKSSALIGKVLEEHLFNVNGAVLIPKGTVITAEHLNIISKHQLFSKIRVGKTDLLPAIESAVQQLDNIFDQIRSSNSLNLGDVYHIVVPTVIEVSESPYINNLFGLLSNRDDYTTSHCFAVSIISTMIGKWMGLEHERIIELATASALHDVGKARIPLNILNKPEKLSKVEFELMKKHTIFGYELIHRAPKTTEEQALAALQHHERMNGSGYLYGLHGSQISYFARIIAIADVFHAMCSKRAYHSPRPTYQILDEMQKGNFGMFDSTILHVFIQKNMEKLIGAEVKLSNGVNGIIRFINMYEPCRPLVETTTGYIDLLVSRDLQIENIL